MFKTLFGGDRPKAEPITEGKPVFLHAHNMSTWNYLGSVTLTYNSCKHEVFQFCRKDNPDVRSFTITGEYPSSVKDHHPYILTYLDPWRVGEFDLYSFVQNNPSKWLKDYMLEKFACVWSEEDKWWKSTDEAKYTSAKKKQDTAKKSSDSDNNVIPVDFGK